MLYILYFLITLILLVLLFSAVTFILACVRRKELPWLDKDIISKTPYARYYPNIIAANEWLQTHHAQEIYITSHDGLRLQAYWIPAENPRGTILLAHGYRSTILVDFSVVMDFYHTQGMNLLLPAQRSHGKSEGKFITFGVKESRDMLGWITYHNQHLGAHPMILSGVSMGSSTMLYLADVKLPDNVRGIIADCGFTSPKEIISIVFTSVTHLPAKPIIWIVDLFARVLAGFSLSEKDSRKTLSMNTLPILMVHGTADDFVPCKMTEQGYEVCAGEKQILLVVGAGHGISFLVDKERYTRMVLDFLAKNLEMPK